MQFTATLLPKTPQYRDLKEHGRQGGWVKGAFFRWNGTDYVATDLTADQINALQIPQVRIEATGVPIDPVTLHQQYGLSAVPTAYQPAVPAPAPGPAPAPVSMPRPLQQRPVPPSQFGKGKHRRR